MCEQKKHSFGNTDPFQAGGKSKLDEEVCFQSWLGKKFYLFICEKQSWYVDCTKVSEMYFFQLTCSQFLWLLSTSSWLWITSTVSESLGGQYEEKLFVAGRWGLPSHSTTPPPHSGQTQIRFQSSNSKFDLFHVEILCAHKHGAYMYYGSFTPCVFVMQSCF